MLYFALLCGVLALSPAASHAQEAVIADAPPMPLSAHEAPEVEQPELLPVRDARQPERLSPPEEEEKIAQVSDVQAPKIEETPSTPPKNMDSVMEQDSKPSRPVIDILPAKSVQADDGYPVDINAPTHPALKITPDKSELVKLDANVSSVIVGNPNHISVLADNSRTLIVVARAPGATYFTALDEDGNVIMQRHVLVASPDPDKKYIRVRKPCNSKDKTCKTTQVYYCPDMCHEILLNVAGNNSGKQQDLGEAEQENDYSPSDQGTEEIP